MSSALTPPPPSTQLRCWDIQPNGQAVPKAALTHEAPVLCADWSADGATVFSGGCSGSLLAWSLATGQQQAVGRHDGPIRHVRHLKEMNLVVTGSWDKSLRYWDLRSPNAVHTQPLPERVYAMDATHPLLVVGCADRTIQVWPRGSCCAFFTRALLQSGSGLGILSHLSTRAGSGLTP